MSWNENVIVWLPFPYRFLFRHTSNTLPDKVNHIEPENINCAQGFVNKSLDYSLRLFPTEDMYNLPEQFINGYYHHQPESTWNITTIIAKINRTINSFNIRWNQLTIEAANFFPKLIHKSPTHQLKILWKKNRWFRRIAHCKLTSSIDNIHPKCITNKSKHTSILIH